MVKGALALCLISVLTLSTGCNSNPESFEDRCIDLIKGNWIVEAVYIPQSQASDAKLQEDRFNDWSDFRLTCYTNYEYVWEDVSGLIVPAEGTFSMSDDCGTAVFGDYTMTIDYLTTDRFEFRMDISGFKGETRAFYFRLIPER